MAKVFEQSPTGLNATNWLFMTPADATDHAPVIPTLRADRDEGAFPTLNDFQTLTGNLKEALDLWSLASRSGIDLPQLWEGIRTEAVRRWSLYSGER